MVLLKFVLGLGFASLAAAGGFASSCDVDYDEELPNLKATCHSNDPHVRKVSVLDLNRCYVQKGNTLDGEDGENGAGIQTCGVKIKDDDGPVLTGGCLDDDVKLNDLINNYDGTLNCHEFTGVVHQTLHDN
ncbi:hypothetical protein NUU61_007188 [Penicillium alfredii]|uniref:Cyanovirin-N domain-containing protein n=1 Tax=Penicillium alfredii TaxID=1506179 RepID=A0A9W9F292_9EURO|nr:uncharacterized protein NUU61_007188 [Penicillium alfredii]KAJ5092318.1 hypothetical protein NUU61_007188 [Penicillium alfredii]